MDPLETWRRPPSTGLRATWLGHQSQHVPQARLRATDVGSEIIWGASANSRTFWRRDSREGF